VLHLHLSSTLLLLVVLPPSLINVRSIPGYLPDGLVQTIGLCLAGTERSRHSVRDAMMPDFPCFNQNRAVVRPNGHAICVRPFQWTKSIATKRLDGNLLWSKHEDSGRCVSHCPTLPDDTRCLIREKQQHTDSLHISQLHLAG
jgi:hypothetical protein